MKKIIVLLLASEFTFSQSCPFKASDPSAVSLASTTAGTIQGLLDSKNQCSSSFNEAVKSVQGLPELMGSVRDPARELEVKLKFINSEIAASLSDAAMANSSESGAYENYAEYLLKQKRKTEQEIKLLRLDDKSKMKEENREKLLGMTWNLMSAASNAISDPNSPCAKSISQKYGSQLLTLGMGAISSAGYLMSAAGGAGITVAAGLLSQVIDLFNRMPARDSLRDFEQTNQTLDLACLYHSIVSLSCDLKDSKSKRGSQHILNEAKKINQNEAFSHVLRGEEIESDISLVISAAVTQDLSIAQVGESTNVDKEMSDLFGERVTISAKDNWEKLLRQFYFVKRILITNSTEFSKLKGEQQTTVVRYANHITESVSELLLAQGEKFVDDKGNEINFNEYFRKNPDKVENAIKKRLKDLSVTSGNGTELNFETSVDLHKSINIKDALGKSMYTKRVYEKMRRSLDESGQLNTPDGKSMQLQLSDAEKVLDSYISWLSVDSKDPDYANALSRHALEMKKGLKSRRDDAYAVRERAKEVFAQPFAKFQQIQTTYEPNLESADLFANPFKPSQKVLSDFERFRALRDVYKQVAEPTIELRDENLVNETRRLFEDRNSLLKENFSKGLQGMKERITSSPDKEIAKKMFSQLCGLSVSLPASESIRECEGAIPEEMKKFIKSNPKEVPDCSYHRYVKDKTRGEYFQTGKTLSLPTENTGTQK